jgi:hypothetical protein
MTTGNEQQDYAARPDDAPVLQREIGPTKMKKGWISDSGPLLRKSEAGEAGSTDVPRFSPGQVADSEINW